MTDSATLQEGVPAPPLTDHSGLRLVDDIDHLLPWARENVVSDIHIGGFGPVWIERHGVLEQQDFGVPEHVISAWLGKNLPEEMLDRLKSVGKVKRGGLGDGSKHLTDVGNLRIHAWRSRNAEGSGLEVTIRLLAPTIPTLEAYDYPSVLKVWAAATSGIVLVGAPTGSGKTTMLAAMVDFINRTLQKHILTVEDPVEYFHRDIRSRIRHCELGDDIGTYEDALVGFLRAKPHVIVVAEIRDSETMANALSAAETGHLVMATVHARDTEQILRRVVDFFPSERQELVRSQLASNLLGVVSCRLPRRRDGQRRIATEICHLGDASIRTSIIANIMAGEFGKIRDDIESGGPRTQSHTLEQDLARLATPQDGRAAELTPEAAMIAAERKEDKVIVQLLERAR